MVKVEGITGMKLDCLIKWIQETFKLKTKREAKKLLFESLFFNFGVIFFADSITHYLKNVSYVDDLDNNDLEFFLKQFGVKEELWCD